MNFKLLGKLILLMKKKIEIKLIIMRRFLKISYLYNLENSL